ncbi:major facilitator superfamily transporter monocarboxylate [Grosmannia clavigera kw1407]|uniref:Major facilitator superfamily transporter monocarboxylate n=1 Tax=Grosmannia clavigera (strain kw1407 / UAMH 11150) TaxID=655863 RepID=F0XLM3_GROCL|nr:major facilitator superfamily transporter monocarboxylate [Grosmannia clavigera kw1407]EFX01144.1 major facilitator superfamily transporter monocarboxylate [Grosmannia clavigera kw1407]
MALDANASNSLLAQLTEAHLARMDAVDETGEAGLPGGLYQSMPASAMDSALTLAASQPGSPLGEKEQMVSPLDRAGAQLEAAPDLEAQSKTKGPADASALTAWSQVAAAFLLNGIAWGTLSMFGVYQLYYTQTMGLPTGTASWVGSLQTFMTYFLSTVSGQLSDSGYAVPTVLAGTLLVLAGGIWTSFSAASLAQLFISQAVITGVGLGLLSAPPLPSISYYFGPDTPRGNSQALALAISTIGSSVGGAVLPAIVQYLLPATSFAWAVRCAALVALVACLGAALLIRTVPTEPKIKPKAEPKGQDQTEQPAGPSRLSVFLDQIADWNALRELPFVLFLASTFFLYWGLYFGFNYMNVYAEKILGMSSTNSTLLLIISTASGIPGRLVSGLLAGYYMGALDCLVIMSCFSAVSIFCWLAVESSTAGMYAFVICFGLGNGLTQGVWLGSIAELMVPPKADPVSADANANAAVDATARPLPRIGARFGMACTVAAFATLIGGPTAAALIHNGGHTASDYHGAIIWSAAVTMGSVVITAFARVSAVGWSPRAGIDKKAADFAAASAASAASPSA